MLTLLFIILNIYKEDTHFIFVALAPSSVPETNHIIIINIINFDLYFKKKKYIKIP